MIQSDVETQSMRIDDLARLSEIPTRTIRFYNTQGLLPPAQIRGRVAFYNQEHLLVLRIIRELKEKQHLPLDEIKQLLAIRARHGDVQMNLTLKQRLLRSWTAGGHQVHLSMDELKHQANVTDERIAELLEQDLLFPVIDDNGEQFFTGDDVVLLDLYQHLEELGLPIALPALIRFQIRQLARNETAACEQYLLPLWRQKQLSLEEQSAQFERVLTLTDTLISILHRKLLYEH